MRLCRLGRTAREVDDGFCEQSAKQFDLLLLPRAASAEVLAEGFVLDVVPTDAHTEAESTSRQQVDVGGLTGHQRGLALRKQKNPGGETDPLGNVCEVAKHDERVVGRIEFGVGPRKLRCSVGVTAPTTWS